MYTYRSAAAAAVASFAPGHVYIADTYSYQYFALHFAEEDLPDTSGPNGTFYLHQNFVAGADSLIGTQTLGEMWAQGMAQGLYGVTGSARSYAFF
jgi:hypothetical protein